MADWSSLLAMAEDPDLASPQGQTAAGSVPLHLGASTEGQSGSSSGVGGTAFFTVTSPKASPKRPGRRSRVVQQLVAEHVASQGNSQVATAKRRLQPRVAAPGIQAPSAVVAPLRVELPKPVLKRPKLGRMGDLALGPHLPHCLALAAEPGASLDVDVSTIAKTYLSSSEYHLMSGVLVDKLLEVDPPSFALRLPRLASTLFVQQVLERRLLEQQLVDQLGQGSLKFYLDYSAYDETPLKVSIREVPNPQGSASSCDAPTVLPERDSGAPPYKPRIDSVITKILQSKSSFGMLLDTVSGEVGIMGQTFCPLQSLSQTNHAVVKEAVARHCPVSFAAEAFQHKLRAVCCDQAGFNRAAEETFLQDRGNWHTTLFYCDVHAIAGCHKKAFDNLLPDDVAGMLRTSLSLRFQNSWSLFRKALEQVVQARIVVVAGKCPAAALAHKNQILTLFLGQSLKRRFFRGLLVDKLPRLNEIVQKFSVRASKPVHELGILKRHISKKLPLQEVVQG